jgi:membrane associated rhomboid family serine protease
LGARKESLKARGKNFPMVMPLWDDNPFTKPIKPWVTWGLIALNVAVYGIETGVGSAELEMLIKDYALTPFAVTHPDSLWQMLPADLTFATYMFLHADIFHLIGNMIFLFVFGDDIEEAMGKLRFLAFYLACGIIGALFFVVSASQSAIPLVGASGAVAGVIAAYLLLRPCAKIRVLFFYVVFRLHAYWVVGSWAALQLMQLAAQPEDDVAYWCHIGGVVAGAVLFPLMRRPGVELFECIEPDDTQVLNVAPPMPDASRLPGAPREPTIR